MELKNKVVSGFIWHSTERLGIAVFQTIISLIIARILGPDAYGLVALLLIFSNISLAVSDGGFSQAIIRKKNPTQEDYTSAFYINLIISMTIYVLLIVLNRPIARLFLEPQLTSIAPYLFLIIPISALGITQNTIIIKEMKFKLSAKINLLTALLSSAIALWLVFNDYGVWAIVWQMVSREIFKVIMLWAWNDWLPGDKISSASLKELFGFGSKMLATSLLSQISANLANFFIGKIYNKNQLAYYTVSQKLKDTFAMSMAQAIMNVSYPALAELQHDDEKLKDAARKVILVFSFLLFPCLAGLIAIADDFFLLVLTDKWMPAVPYFKILCLSAFFIPSIYVCVNLLRVKGLGTLVLNLEVAKRVFMLVTIIITAFISVKAITWGVVVYTFWDMLLNVIYAKRKVGYSFIQQIGDIAPYLMMSGLMYLAVIAVSLLSPYISPVFILMLKMSVGAGIYVGIGKIFKPQAWIETIAITKKLLRK